MIGVRRQVAADRAKRWRIRRASARAFTLVELVALIAVLGIIAISAAPGMAGVSRAVRAAGAIQISRDFSYARELALASGQRTWISLRRDGLGYRLLGDDLTRPGLRSATLLDDPASGAGFDVTLNAGRFVGVRIGAVEIAGGGTDLGFDWLGRPLSGAGSQLSDDSRVEVDEGPAIVVRGHSGLVVVEGGAW